MLEPRADSRSQRDFKLELVCAALARRRRAAAIAASGSAVSGQGPQGSKPEPHWAGFVWEDHVGRLTESEFKLRYRLAVDAFYDLADILREDLSVLDEAKARATKWGQLIAVETKLAIGLRFLAGGHPLDLKLIYDVDRSYVYTCVWMVVDAVNERIKVEFPLKDPQKLARLEAEFRAHSRQGVWSGQVGAVDGVHFAMLAPTEKDVNDPLKYYVQRKHCYALLAIAVCDYHRRFTFWDISQTPLTHDSLAWSATELGQAVAQGELPFPYFINADAAFALSPSVVTPSGGVDDDFDFEQSSNRMPIECAFGMLIKRWGVLYKPLGVAFPRRAPLISACMRLHNFCIDRRIEDETKDINGLTNLQPEGRHQWALTPLFDLDGAPLEALDIERGPRQPIEVRQQAKTVTRDRLMTAIRDAGLVRPTQLPPHMHRRRVGKKGRKRKQRS